MVNENDMSPFFLPVPEIEVAHRAVVTIVLSNRMIVIQHLPGELQHSDDECLRRRCYI